MPDRRVAITGLGAVTAAGIGAEALWSALLEGRSCVKTISLFDAGGFPCTVAGQVDDFSARDFVPKSYRKATKVMARDIQLAVAAADQAVRDARLVTRAEDADAMTYPPGRFGCNIGAGLINPDLTEMGLAANTAVTDGTFDIRLWGEHGMNNLTPLWLLKYLPNMLSCHVTIIHGCEGASNTITCGDASGHMSIGEAARWIQRGAADAVIAGGAESKLNPMGVMRQVLLKRPCTSRNDDPPGACRPFDAGHDGTVGGEGGGLVIIEEMDSAVRRGATIYAELAGFGAACDPGGMDITRPTVGSLDMAVGSALRDAGLGPDDVDVVVAHGTGVPGEDNAEADAWSAALGQRVQTAPAVAVTGTVGSTYAGAGGIELIVAAMALHTQTVPPTVNFTAPAGGCRLNLSSRQRSGPFDTAVSGAFSIGGQSGAVVLKKYQP